MRLTTGISSGKAAFYDRNPTEITAMGFTNLAGTGPHAGTTRFTYTVPAARKVILGSTSLWIQRETAATTAGDAALRVLFGFAAGEHIVGFDNLTVDTRQVLAFGQGTIRLAGAVTSCQSYDNSTGGTIEYSAVIPALEFDA